MCLGKGRISISLLKRIAIILLVLAAGWAAPPAQAAVEAVAPSPVIMANGQPVKCDVPPYIDSSGRTMVPVRFVVEALGAGVEWQEAEKKVLIRGAGREIELVIGSRSALVDGEQWDMDTVPVLKNDRTMVPLRFIGEALGISVDWLAETRTVDIRLPVQSVSGTVVVKEELVNLRSGPGTVFERVGQAVQGDIFKLTGKAGNWYQITTGAGKEVWVASWLVEVQESRAEEPASGSRGGDRGGRVPAGQSHLSVSSVKSEGETTSFIVRAGGVEAPRLSLLEQPRQLLLDFAGITLKPSNPGEALELKGRLASKLHTLQLTPDIVQVVVELQGPCSYSVTRVSPESFLVKIEPPDLDGRLVVIDPGHGNFKSGGWTDPGAIGSRSGLHEADLVLEMGLKVAELLQARGAKVLLTRRGNAWLTLEERAQLANQAGADVFVSIHANSSVDPGYSGSSVYYYAPGGSQRAQRMKLASCLQRQLLLELGRNDQGVREYDFSVLRHTTVPSALVEVAYLSNPEEERLLGNAEFRQKAAEAIAAGITDYLQQSPAA